MCRITMNAVNAVLEEKGISVRLVRNKSKALAFQHAGNEELYTEIPQKLSECDMDKWVEWYAAQAVKFFAPEEAVQTDVPEEFRKTKYPSRRDVEKAIRSVQREAAEYQECVSALRVACKPGQRRNRYMIDHREDGYCYKVPLDRYGKPKGYSVRIV